MAGRGESEGTRRTVVYCVVPRDLVDKLHEPLRRHFRDEPSVRVIVERRRGERRDVDNRRATEGDKPTRRADRRRVQSPAGRRGGERRALLVRIDAPELPRRARAHADRLVFVERLEPATDVAENADSARLAARFQAGDKDAFAALYMRYYDRVYSYLRVMLRSPSEAEDSTQQVFMKVFEALPRYEDRGQPLTAWLFTIVRNQGLADVQRNQRSDPVDPQELAATAEAEERDEPQLDMLEWISDSELLMFVERLPLPQRQALVLRFLFDMSSAQVAQVLGRSHDDVRQLESRGLRFLRARLGAVGRESSGRGDRIRMRAPLVKSRVARQRRFALGDGPAQPSGVGFLGRGG